MNNNFGAECILCTVKSTVFLSDLEISGNYGNFSIIYLLKTETNITGRIIFSSNVGALLVINSHVQFSGFTKFEKCLQSWLVPKNNGLQCQGTLTAIQSTIVFCGNETFIDNYSKQSGSAIYSYECKISIYSQLLIVNNTAEESGGGVFLYLSVLICHGNCTFIGNKATVGGGIHAVSSPLLLSNGTQKAYFAPIVSLSFIGNEAKSGGALYFELNSYLKCIIDRLNDYRILLTATAQEMMVVLFSFEMRPTLEHAKVNHPMIITHVLNATFR